MRNTSPLLNRDPEVVALWHEQMALAVNTPNLLFEGMRNGEELFPRFAAYYTYLKALPRRVRKGLQRHWRLPLAGVALMLALGQSPALAATIPVGGSCNLVNAITAANSDTATGGCPAGSGADTIVLPPGSTHTLTNLNNNTYGPTGLPVISSPITIEGQESTIRRDTAAPEFRMMAVSINGKLTLQNTTISGGKLPFDTPILLNNSGGGVVNFNGTLTVTNSTISGNSAGSGGGVYNKGTIIMSTSTITGNSAVVGGGVANINGILTVANSTISGNSASNGGGVDNSGTLTMTNSTISGNSAYENGGGVLNFGTATVLNSTITYNSAFYFGGGGVRSDGSLTVINSTISGNDGAVGGGVWNFGGIVTVMNSTISGNYGTYGGAGVANGGTLTMTNSTISGNYVRDLGGGVFNGGTLTMTNSTITGNSAFLDGGGVSNFGGLTVINSTITGNSAGGAGGGVENTGTVTVSNSTISGNAGDGVNNDSYGTVTLINSTISGNAGTGVYNRSNSTLNLVRTLVTGNTGFFGPEIFNAQPATVIADNHNLFGFNGNAGVVGFTPGPTDIVPPAGVQLSNILDPVLSFNGGPTETHALVPGSPAIDAGGPVCTDANGNPLLTDQRGKPRIIDGNSDGTARCDIGAFEFFPIVNNLVALNPALDTSFDPTPVPGAPGGSFTIGATFTNMSGMPLRFPFFTVTELSGDNLLLNAEEGARGVGATVTPDVADQVLSPGETVQVDFVIGLQTPTPFTFFVDLFAEPLVSGASTSRHRPNIITR